MEIFDAYVEDLIRQEKAKDKKGKGGSSQDEEKKKAVQSDLQNDDVTRVAAAAKVMERMVNQNTFDDIAQGKTGLCSNNPVVMVGGDWLRGNLQISSITRTLGMTIERAKATCSRSGDSSMTRPRRQRSLPCAGTLSTVTCLQWGMDHVCETICARPWICFRLDMCTQ